MGDKRWRSVWISDRHFHSSSPISFEAKSEIWVCISWQKNFQDSQEGYVLITIGHDNSYEGIWVICLKNRSGWIFENPNVIVFNMPEIKAIICWYTESVTMHCLWHNRRNNWYPCWIAPHSYLTLLWLPKYNSHRWWAPANNWFP